MKMIRRTLVFIIVGALLSFAVYKAVTKFTIRTESVTFGSLAITKTATAKITREEVVLSSDISGDVFYNVLSGQRVKKGVPIASVYDETVSEQDINRLKTLAEKISLLEAVLVSNSDYKTDSLGSERAAKEFQKNIIWKTLQNDIGGISKEKNLFLTSLNSTNVKNDLQALKNEKSSIENKQKGHYKQIIAPCSGVFISDNGVGKIVNNFEILLTAQMGNNGLSNLKQGQNAKVDFIDKTLFGVASEIKEIKRIDNENVEITFILRRFTDEFLTSDTVNCRFVLGEKEGLKLPKRALKVQNDVFGVTVITPRSEIFREVEIITGDDEFILIKDGGKVKLHDEVQVN